jgi:hypothetical protein
LVSARDGLQKGQITVKWIGGFAEWIEGDTVFMSIAFTWKLRDAFSRALFWRSQGKRVVAGRRQLRL